MPSTSVWMSEASPRQYSAEVLVVTIFGNVPRASRRPSSAPRSPVTGSTSGVSVNGNRLPTEQVAFSDG